MAFRLFQSAPGLIEAAHRYYDAFEQRQGGEIPTDAQYQAAAETAGVPAIAIKALWQVETAQVALLDGRPLIRIEPGKWSQFGGRKSDLPKPLNPEDQAVRWANFEMLSKIDPLAAILSSSIGGGQIMGFNSEMCGFQDPALFWKAQKQGAGAQLQACARFIAHPRNAKLKTALVNGDAQAVAFHYNGSGYARNRYDVKYQTAVRRFSHVV